MDSEKGSQHTTLTGFPRLVVETDQDITEMVDAASRIPKAFPGLGPEVYLDRKPPFVVGTYVSQSAILGWLETADSDPRAVEHLATLGIERDSQLAA
jgi:hypothetical protein